MERTQLCRIARAFMALCGSIADAARAGTFTHEAFKRRIERNRAYIVALASSDDIRLRELADLMTSILADAPRIESAPDVDERLLTNSRRFQKLMTEVTMDGDRTVGSIALTRPVHGQDAAGGR